MKTIVALIDFSDTTARVVDHTLEFARACGSEVILVHVVQMDPIMVDYLPATVPDEKNCEAKLAGLLALRDSMKERGIVVTTRLFEGPVVETLLARMAALKPDLIIMGSHGHGTLYNMIVGTVTEGFIKRSAWPVTIIPRARAADSLPVLADDSEKIKAGKTPKLIGAVGGTPFPI